MKFRKCQYHAEEYSADEDEEDLDNFYTIFLISKHTSINYDWHVWIDVAALYLDVFQTTVNFTKNFETSDRLWKNVAWFIALWKSNDEKLLD